VTTSSIQPPAIERDAAEPQEKDRARDATAKLLEHEYDGIREYDSPLPGWWVKLFWASFVFSLAYVFHYYVSERGQSVIAAYDEDVQQAKAERAKQSLGEAPSEEVLGALMADKQLMQDAKALFEQRCSPCHGAAGQGLIGPNLTDDHWIHGEGQLMDIYQVVSHGVADKGMPAWELQLDPVQVRKLVAFVGTLRGQNVTGKAPEGHVVGAH
jgi:cytochrome c oxidase cbb3-type subunit 3